MNSNTVYRCMLVVYVLIIYAFYPSFHLFISTKPYDLYQFLTEGFLSGHLYLNVWPSPELLNLPDPYNPVENIQFKLHDASLYQGKYYLYFGLLPVILFFLPFKLLTGFYASSGFGVFFFLSLAFMVSFFLLIKIRDKCFPQISDLQLILAGLLLSLGNGVTVLLSVPRVYEVAISSALCFMIFSFYFLYQLVNNEQKTKDVFLFSLCLSLTVGGRPHFALVCLVLIPAVLFYLMSNAPKNRRLILLSTLLIPPLFVALILGGYNYLRFGSVFDFGHIWQLSCQDLRDLHVELVDLTKIPRNLWYSFYFYFLQPFTISLRFPFFGLRMHNCWYIIDKDYFPESVAGALLISPFIVLVLALPKLLRVYLNLKNAVESTTSSSSRDDSSAFFRLKEKKDRIPLAWFLLFASVVPTINALFLLVLPFAIQRYMVDFLPYFVILAIISFWMLDDYLGHSLWSKLIKIFFMSTAILSVILGLSFSFAYWVFK